MRNSRAESGDSSEKPSWDGFRRLVFPADNGGLMVRMAVAVDERRFLAVDRRTLYADLYRKHHGAIYRLCLFMVKDKEEARQLCQDVFLNAIGNWSGFSGLSQPSTWLFAIARNACFNHLRRRKVHEERADRWREPLYGSGSTDGKLEDRLLTAVAFSRALAHAAPATRKILVLYYKDGLTQSEIASVIGLSRAAVCKVLAKWAAGWSGRADSERFREPKSGLREHRSHRSHPGC
jgi:RNA polymerase sigma-70 factor, ECF subfamily